MEALIIAEPGRSEVVERSEPTPAPGEVLLRVRTVGFCGSDLNTFRGLNPLVSYPRVPGHEIAARVEAVGQAVPSTIRVGTDVTVLPYTSCGRCAACLRGRVNACRDNQTLGVQRDGALTSLIAIPHEKVVLAEGLSLRELALVEPLSVGFHAVDRARVAAEDTVAVIGCGAVGLGAIAAAAQRGATVIAVDVDDRKLQVARRAGAAHGVNSASVALHERLQALSGDRGPDVIVEAVGLPETFRAAVEEVAFTGRVVYIGYARAPVAYETAQFVKKEIDILGSRNALVQDFAAVIDMLQKGSFPVDEMVSLTVPLEGACVALETWSARPSDFTRIHVDLE